MGELVREPINIGSVVTLLRTYTVELFEYGQKRHSVSAVCDAAAHTIVILDQALEAAERRFDRLRSALTVGEGRKETSPPLDARMIDALRVDLKDGASAIKDARKFLASGKLPASERVTGGSDRE